MPPPLAAYADDYAMLPADAAAMLLLQTTG